MRTVYDADLLLVDDNPDLLRLLSDQLSGAGYRHIRTAANCAAAQTAFSCKTPELMILDINLPDGDGFSLFRFLREKVDVPALFLSARDADADRLFGLGLGADRLPDQAVFDAGASAPRAAYFAACLPHGTFPHPPIRSAARRPAGRFKRRHGHVIHRQNAFPDGDGTRAAGKAGGESRPYRDLRRALRRRLGRGTTPDTKTVSAFISATCGKRLRPNPAARAGC